STPDRRPPDSRSDRTWAASVRPRPPDPRTQPNCRTWGRQSPFQALSAPGSRSLANDRTTPEQGPHLGSQGAAPLEPSRAILDGPGRKGTAEPAVKRAPPPGHGA